MYKLGSGGAVAGVVPACNVCDWTGQDLVQLIELSTGLREISKFSEKALC